MKKILFWLLLFICVGNVVTSCVGNSDKYQDCTPMELARLDKVIFNYSSLTEEERGHVDSVMKNGISAISIMLNMGHPDDSTFVKYIGSDAVKMFTPEVEKCFDDVSILERQLGCIRSNFEKELPQVKLNDVYAIVSPYRQSIYIADSTLLLALNHYLGKTHSAYDGFEEYIKRAKEAKYIPYDVVEALIRSFIPFESNGDDILLAKMLYAGAIVVAKMQIVPDASLAQALGYDDKELDWVVENETDLWNSLVSKELLYSTSYFDVKQLLMLSPNTSVLHADAPGRVGVYLGYRIVSSYLKKNSNTTLKMLFDPQFYQSQQTLVASGYHG